MHKSLRLVSVSIAMALVLAFAGLMLWSLPAIAEPATPPAQTGPLRCSGSGSGSAGVATQAAATPDADQNTPIPSPSDAPVLRVVTDIPLSGGTSRFDYQSLDPVT